MKYAFLTVLMISLAAPPTTMAQGGGLESKLYPPELVMKFATDIELTEAQREAIREEIKALKSDIVDLQWKLEEEGGRLDAMLRDTVADVDAVLAQADRVIEIEWQVKKRHLAALLRIKNALTAEQQNKLLLVKQKGPGALRKP